MGQIRAPSPPTSLNSTGGLGKLGVSAETLKPVHLTSATSRRAAAGRMRLNTCFCTSLCHAWWHLIGSWGALMRQKHGLPLNASMAAFSCENPNKGGELHAFLQKRAPAWGHGALLYPPPPSVSASNLSKQPALQCLQELLILSSTAPVGLGSGKESARLDRRCFVAARLRG